MANDVPQQWAMIRARAMPIQFGAETTGRQRDETFQSIALALVAARQDGFGMSAENTDKLGRLADALDAALYSAKLLLSPKTHMDALTGQIREARDICAAIVREETGADPWETNPLSG